MIKAIINAAGKVVNIIVIDQAELDKEDGWTPPAGHTLVDRMDSRKGDIVDTVTGVVVTRKPEPPALPSSEISIYSGSEDTPQSTFLVNAIVGIKVTLPAAVTARSILVPIDRLDANGNVVIPAVKWLNMEFTAGVATASVTFSESGRYGVGPRTSDEFEVPETFITVHD